MIFRSITGSFSRFWAIFLIVALGAGFYAGLRSTGQDMRVTGDRYFDDGNVMDVRILSTLGLTEEDASAVSQTPGVLSVMPAHFADVISNIAGMDQVFRIHSIPEGGPGEADMNRPNLLSGRWPESGNECVVGARKTDESRVKIGDFITVSDQDGSQRDQLQYGSYEIVGVVDSAYYICFNLGTTDIGNGTLNYFMYIPESGFDQEVYTELFVTVEGAAGENTFSGGYDRLVSSVTDALKALAPEREQARYDEVYSEAKKELDEGRAEYEESKEEAYKELADALLELEDGEKTVAENEQKLTDAQAELNSGKAELVKNEAELADRSGELSDALSQWTSGKEALDASQTQWEQGSRELESKTAETEAQLSQLEALIGSGYPGAPATREEYEQTAAAARAQLAAARSELDGAKSRLDAGYAELEAQRRQLDAAQSELEKGKTQLESARRQLEDAQRELDSGKRELADAKTELADGRAEYEEGKETADRELADAAVKLEDGEKELSKLKVPEWYVLDRDTNVGYASFRGDTERMDSLSTVFPLIFFLVAALVALTTMTRMVEEERVQIGTYKALGYSNGRIASKYLIYAGTASSFGSLIGIVGGMQVLPRVVWSAYSILYDAPPIIIAPNLVHALLAALVSVACTMIATYAAARSSLGEVPAGLMLPRAPKAGKRILLERIGPLWRRMSFTWKVTARNLFRYKKRLLMTVVGIAGCTGLLLTGYGVRDAVEAIVSYQFLRVYAYDASIGLKDGEIGDELRTLLDDKSQFEDWTAIYSKTMDVTKDGETMTASLLVPESGEKLPTFIHLNNRVTRKAIPFGADAVVVTEKLARQLDISPGDSITVKNGSGKEMTLRVTGVTENYVYHYVYVSPSLYAGLMGEEAGVNEVLTVVPLADDAARAELSRKAMSLKDVGTFAYTEDILSRYDDMVSSMNLIVLVLIVSAGLLAFIVLYNLTNINVTERLRELATIKVLGFYDKEVSAYVFRETALLTIIGCLLGLGLGVLLNQFVVETAEVDMIMFGRVIQPLSYVWSAAFTLLFGVIVNLVMYPRLKKIDMVESLKSVD